MGIPALFEVRTGISFGSANLLSGEGAPGVSGGLTDEAGRGSLYLDLTNGLFYGKKLAGSGSDKWVRLQGKDDLDAALLGQSWREPARLRDASTYADLAAAETAVNAGTIDGVTLAEGDRLLFDNITGAAKNVFIVTGTPGSGATLVEDGNSASKGDAIFIQEGSDAGRQFVYNGTAWVQQGAASSTEIAALQAFIGKSGNGNEMPDYASTHVITDGDPLEKAIGDLDAEIGAPVASPVARSLPGGSISDQAVNRNLQALDTALGSNPTSTRIISAANPVNANLSLLDDRLADARTESDAPGITTAVTLDSVPVDESLAVEWTVHARSVANPAKVWSGKILAVHDGTGATDATQAKHTAFAILKTGSISQLDFDVDLNGAGISQVLRLRVSSGEAADLRAVRSVVTGA